jgi:hypothetical protein
MLLRGLGCLNAVSVEMYVWAVEWKQNQIVFVIKRIVFDQMLFLTYDTITGVDLVWTRTRRKKIESYDNKNGKKSQKAT